MHRDETLRLKNGREVACRWDFAAEGRPALPMVFLVPSDEMRDLNGNGPGYPTRDSLRDLSHALLQRGITAFRYSAKPALVVQEVVEVYEHALSVRSTKETPVALVGIAEGADLIAKEFYSFYRVRMPKAAALLSAAVSPLHLNNLTCPYLLVHGANDPLFQWSQYSRFEEAVHHHQYRYGDRTSHKLVEGLGRELGRGYLDAAVAAMVVDWLDPAIREGVRPQEPAAA